MFILIKHNRDYLSYILNIIATSHRNSVHSVYSPPLISPLHLIARLFLPLVSPPHHHHFRPLVSLPLQAPTTSGLGGLIWVLPPNRAHPSCIKFRWRWLCLSWKCTEITKGKSKGDKMLHASEPFFYFPNSQSSLNMCDSASGPPPFFMGFFHETWCFFTPCNLTAQI